MKELTIISPKSDSITAITATTASDSESECSFFTSSPKAQSPSQSLSSLSYDWNEMPSNDNDEENNAFDYSIVTTYSYSPQHDDRKKFSRSKIRHEEYIVEPRKKNKYRNSFISSLVLVASISLVLSSLLISIYSPLKQYNPTPIDEKQMILQDVFSQPVMDDYFTIRLSVSHGRMDILRNSIDSHSACGRVKQIQVDWRSDVDVPEVIMEQDKVVIVKSQVSSSWDVGAISTNGVLLLSDDVVLTCKELDTAFEIWKQNPDRMVGFFPYHYNQSPQNLSNLFTHPYKLTPTQRNYSILSDRASFLHRLYLRTMEPWMTSETPCKSIALSLKIASISNKSPMVVASKPLQIQSSASMRRFYEEKHREWIGSCHDCLSRFMKKLNLDRLPSDHRVLIRS